MHVPALYVYRVALKCNNSILYHVAILTDNIRLSVAFLEYRYTDTDQ